VLGGKVVSTSEAASIVQGIAAGEPYLVPGLGYAVGPLMR